MVHYPSRSSVDQPLTMHAIHTMLKCQSTVPSFRAKRSVWVWHLLSLSKLMDKEGYKRHLLCMLVSPFTLFWKVPDRAIVRPLPCQMGRIRRHFRAHWTIGAPGSRSVSIKSDGEKWCSVRL